MQNNELSVVEWANSLNADELRNWLRQRLQGNDSRWPVDRMSEEPPHHLVDVLLRHSEVRPETHAFLMDGVLTLTRECLENSAKWEDSAVIELLLIAPVALRGTRYEPEARRWIATNLSKLVSGRVSEDKIESYALRCLLDLGLQETPEFWIAKDRPGNALRNTIICQALLRLDQFRLFQWLESRDADDLKQLLMTLGRSLRRRCEADLRFAKALRAILKGKELHVVADEITQIGTVRPSNSASISVLRTFRGQIEHYGVPCSAIELEILGLETETPEILYHRRMENILAPVVRTLEALRDMEMTPLKAQGISEGLARSLGFCVRPDQRALPLLPPTLR